MDFLPRSGRDESTFPRPLDGGGLGWGWSDDNILACVAPLPDIDPRRGSIPQGGREGRLETPPVTREDG